MTLQQWALLPEDMLCEWRDGRLEERKETGFMHAMVVSWLGWIVRSWLAQQRSQTQQRGGFVAVSTVKYAVSPTRGRMPDLTVFLLGGRVPPREGLITIPTRHCR